MRSQVQLVGAFPPGSWDDYEHGCLQTYGGGYREEHEREIFRHGMSTIFNLLRAEFPEAALCKAAPELLEVAKGYERWEGELVMDGRSWQNSLPEFTQEAYDSWMELQAKRNEVVRKVAG